MIRRIETNKNNNAEIKFGANGESCLHFIIY
jgi:hypothetical protein